MQQVCIQKMLSYKVFLENLLERYEPLPYEVDQNSPLYGAGKQQNWAVRHSKRFYHTYCTCFPYVQEGATVLDVGAYPGSYLKILRLLYGSKISLIAAGMPVQPSFPSDMKALDVDFIPCDLDDVLLANYPATLEIEDSDVDVVICTEVIEHLYSVKRLMAEIHRVLKPGAVAYISTNNVAYLPGLVRLAYGETNLDVELNQTSALAESEWRGHVRFFSLNQLVGLAILGGLETVDKGYYQMRVPKIMVSKAAQVRWWASRLLDMVVKFLPVYRSHIYILAQKSSNKRALEIRGLHDCIHHWSVDH